MAMIAPQTTTDPLGAFVTGAFTREEKRPIPLVSTSFDVDIDAGLAIVATKRVFWNDEPDSIEATITFPVPVHATQFSLEARIDGRLLKARAQRRSDARETYEGAIDRGKAAVLHEEVLRGVHMLSVAHIPPGARIEVSTVWAMTLTVMDGIGSLRIPLTVGDVYGRSRLPDSDDLIHGGAVQTAQLTVHCREGSVALACGKLEEGHARVRLDTPIDLEVTGWTFHDLHGLAADGREVVLRLEPQAAEDAPLDVALLIDHSGSMAESYSCHRADCTKHQAAIEGLKSVASRLGESDVLDLWEFGNTPAHVGSTHQSLGQLKSHARRTETPGERFIGQPAPRAHGGHRNRPGARHCDPSIKGTRRPPRHRR